MTSRANLRLVSFDSGGVRSFSQLGIMDQIMHQLSYEKYPNASNKLMLPCEHFDLMGGSGTGGLIAIMFTKLHMSVEEVSNEFFMIVEEVYKPQDLPPSERTQKLRGCMEYVMGRKGLPIDMKFTEKAKPGDCASFVLASLRTDAANKVCLRSYPVRSQLSSTITVIEAALATCAVPPRFSPVTSGSGHNMVEYIGASFGASNPVREVITQAHTLFGGDSSVASLLSLGTGHPGVISFPSGDGADLNRVMRDMMNDCEQRAQEIERQIGRVGIYSRFSVEQGMQSDPLGPLAEPSRVVSETKSYLAEQTISEKVDDFIRNFDTAARLITLDQLEYAGGSAISIQSAATLEAILAALESNHEDAILAKLKVADLECGPHTAGCMEGTRRDILERINTWTTDFNAPNILWLKGHPGVGKSAVASSLVEQLRAARRLGSRFFFQKQRSNVMTTNALWRTVAYDLAREYPTVRKHLVATLEADETIPTAFNVDRLFRQLVQEPILASHKVPVGRLPIVVVDALDECGGLEGQHSSHRRKLVRTLQLWSSLPLKFKLIVTSRDESDIAGTFLRTSHHPIEISAGQTVEKQSSEDIRTFLTYRFQKIALRYPGSLSLDWPGPEAIIQMAGTAAGLFLWAETVIRFIDLGEPKQRLGLVSEGDGTGDMAKLYEQILRTSFASLNEHEVENLCSVIGTIILAKAPLSFSTLVRLLSMDGSIVEQICIGLQSVLESQSVLIFHHQSFIDFLIDPARSASKFFVKREHETRTLTMACLRAMRDELRFNICDFKSSYLRNTEVPDLASRVEERILPYLSYSTLFWSSHLAETTFDIEVYEELQYFMDNQFLFWLEVLSLTKRVNLASGMLLLLADWIKAGQRDDAMARGMRKFVTGFGNAISQSVAHIYLSAVPFSPRNSEVSKRYRQQFARTIAMKTGGLIGWPATQNVLSGHSEMVRSVAFSPDGTRIVSGSKDKMIRVWDAETGETIAGPFEGHRRQVLSVAFSPDGNRIVSGSGDYTIRVWDAETGEVLAGPFKHNGWVRSVAFSPDGMRVVSGSDDKTIRVWNAKTGENVAEPFIGHNSFVKSVAFSPDGKRVISGSNDKTILVWDVETGHVVVGPLEGHHSEVGSVGFSPDGTRVVSGSRDKTIRVWNAETGALVAGPFEGHSEWVKSVAFSPDGKRIVSGSGDHTVRVWDALTGEVVAGPFKGHSERIQSVAFSPDGTRLISGSRDKTIRLWDIEMGVMGEGPFKGHSDWISSVVFSPDGKRIASCSYDGTIRVWDAETGEGVAGAFVGHNAFVNSVAFSPDGRRVVSGGDDNTIRVWDAETGELVVGPLEGHSVNVGPVTFSPDGKRIVSGSDDKTIRVWDAETGEAVAGPFQGHSHWIMSVACSPNGTRVVSGAADKTARVWDAETGELVAGPFKGHSDIVISVAFSPDGRRIVSSSGDGTIRVWDAETADEVVGPLEGHSGRVWSVSFSPDGTLIVSGSEDKTIRVWNALTGEVVAGPFEWHRNFISSVAFSPDGKRVVSGSVDATIRVWNVTIGDSDCHNHDLPSFTDSSVIQDGWMLGSSSELLFWVPPELREGLFWPNSRLVMGNFIKTKLDFALFAHGESWAQCRE